MTASRSLMWLTNTPYCQCWGLGTSDSISDTTYTTSASGTSLVGRGGGRGLVTVYSSSRVEGKGVVCM